MFKNISLTGLLQDFVNERYSMILFVGENIFIEEIFIENTLKFMLNSNKKIIYIDKIHNFIRKNFYINEKEIFKLTKEYYMMKNKQKNRQIILNYIKEFSNYDIYTISKITLSENPSRALLASTILSLYNALVKEMSSYVDSDTLDIIYHAALRERICVDCIKIVRKDQLEYTDLFMIKSKYILFLNKYNKNLEKVKNNIVCIFYDTLKENIKTKYHIKKRADKIIILFPEKTEEITIDKFLTNQT